MAEGVADALGPVPGVRTDVPVEHQAGTAVFDLLDEMPHHQRGDSLIARAEQRITVVQNDFEQGSERRLQVGDVGGVELDRLLLEQLVVSAAGILVALLEVGIARHQRQHVFAVRGRVLRLLPQKSFGLGGDSRILLQFVLRPANDVDDVALERDGDEGERVAEQTEIRILGLPHERHARIELPRDLADHEVGHRRYLPIDQAQR